MRGPTLLRAARRIAAKDLHLEWRTWDALSSSFVFALVVLLVFRFAVSDSADRAEHLLPGALWLAIGFAAVVGVARSMDVERRGETFSALFRAPIDPSAIYLGKLLANIVRLLALGAVLLPLAAVFYNAAIGKILPQLALVVVVCTLGLCELGTLFAAIVSRIGRGEALLATLLLPAATPLLLAGIHATSGLVEGTGLGPVRHWLGLAFGFDLLYFFLALATFEFVLEE